MATEQSVTGTIRVVEDDGCVQTHTYTFPGDTGSVQWRVAMAALICLEGTTVIAQWAVVHEMVGLLSEWETGHPLWWDIPDGENPYHDAFGNVEAQIAAHRERLRQKRQSERDE